jgi:hypothetical protein
MGLLFRVLFGYIIACLVAGLAIVLFAWTPSDLAAMEGDAANEQLTRVLPVAIHIFLFSSVPALIAFMFGERHHRRDWFYYALVGVVIALIGFGAQHISEEVNQTWHIADNTYPLFAFITTGFLGGLAYWIFSGRHSGLHTTGTPTNAKPMPPLKPGTPPGTSARPSAQRT